MEKILTVDAEQCGGCHTCELICSWTHNPGEVRPSVSRIRVLRDEKQGLNLPTTCLHCEKPICQDACPEDAIGRDAETEAVEMNMDVCTSCKACMVLCPFDAIGVDSVTEVMIKCDLCKGNPKCVQWCPKGAIRYEKAEIAASSKQSRIMGEYLRKRRTALRRQWMAANKEKGNQECLVGQGIS